MTQPPPNASTPPADSEDMEAANVLQFLAVAAELAVTMERFAKLAELLYPGIRARTALAADHPLATSPEQPPVGQT